MTTTPKEEKKCTHRVFEDESDCPICVPSQEVSEWEKEFDKKFRQVKAIPGFARGWINARESIKRFIHKVRNQTLEAAAESLEKEKIDINSTTGNVLHDSFLSQGIGRAQSVIRGMKK